MHLDNSFERPLIMKLKLGRNILVIPTEYERYAGFLHPAISEKKDNESAVMELKENARLVSRVKTQSYSVSGENFYRAQIVFTSVGSSFTVEQFEKELRQQALADRALYRYANLCEVLTYCEKTSWHKDTFLVPGTFYQDEFFHRYILKCSIGKIPMFEPKVLVEIKPWTPTTKLGLGKIPLVKTEVDKP
ncbi:MAG: hypothetical protein LiPW30_245 [Parcubacteria group bacterium LiPW_30]|nr:MAG: hypothetical protein LiPW30_245 [Parcubacteria group bacterium LiPW_30]